MVSMHVEYMAPQISSPLFCSPNNIYYFHWTFHLYASCSLKSPFTWCPFFSQVPLDLPCSLDSEEEGFGLLSCECNSFSSALFPMVLAYAMIFFPILQSRKKARHATPNLPRNFFFHPDPGDGAAPLSPPHGVNCSVKSAACKYDRG